MQIYDIRVAGARSPVWESGDGAADEAAVFVHGNPGSAADWEDLLPRVGAFGRALALDMPGFGAADKPADFAYTVDGYARHLEGALQALGVRRAHLVLHDFGGPWGLAWGERHLDQVASLTLINTGFFLRYRWHYLARIWRTPALGEAFMATATLPAFRLLLKHGNPRGLPDAFVRRMFGHFDQGTRRAILKLYRATPDPASISERFAAAFRPRALPALVVWGMRDPYIPGAFARRQLEALPGARIVELPDSGHWPFADNPAAVAAAVVPFLRDRLAPVAAKEEVVA